MLKKQANLALDLSSTDIDDQSLMLDGWKQKYTQLETGSFKAKTSSLSLPDGNKIFRKYTNRRMSKYFVTPDNSIRLAVALPGSNVCLFQGQKILSGDLFVLKPGIELELICHGKLDVAVIEFESILNSSNLKGIHNNHQEILDVLPKHETNGFAEKITTAFLQGIINAELFSSLCAPAIRAIYYKHPIQNKNQTDDVVTKAIRLVERCLADRKNLPKIPEIAAHLGVSERRLEYAFARKCGLSPIQYFKFMRLHGARREIRLGKLNITDAAIKWGFSNLGRFSGYYRNTFGELPSHTK